MYNHNQEDAKPIMQNQRFPQQYQMVPLRQERGPDRSGFGRLNRDGVYIRQKINKLEVVTGCVQKNTYYVYPLGEDGEKKGHKMFKAKEESDCCARQFTSGNCRPFNLKVNLEDDNEEIDNQPFLFLERPCACTCLCFDRPEVSVHYVENGANQYLGKITNPFNCCDDVLEIYDKAGFFKYKIVGNCCQLGMWCQAPCESCQIIDFEVRTRSGVIVSTFQKRTKSCLAACFTDANDFSVNFPPNAANEDKALLMSAVLFLDYMYFNEEPNRPQANNCNITINNE